MSVKNIPGNASNNCSVLSKLGAKCEFLGMASASSAFEFLYEDCRQRSIHIENCPKTQMDPPFSSVILVKSKGSRTIIHSNPGFPILTYEHFKKIDLSLYSWIHFEGRNTDETKQMINMIRGYNQNTENKIKISVELEKLKRELFELAIRADVVFIAKDMAEHMGWLSSNETVFEASKLIKEMQLQSNLDNDMPWPLPSIVSPWGSAGSDCLTSAGVYFTFPAVNVKNIVDSLGAGDTFVAGFIYAMQHLSMSAPEAVSYANKVAAFKIQHKGYDALIEFKI